MDDSERVSTGFLPPIDTFNLHLLRTYPETIADGEGLRYAIYLAGCNHQCPGCQNPASWCATGGIPLDEPLLNSIIQDINRDSMLDGVTLSGGDPFFNPLGLLALLRRLKRDTHANVWCYTGYTIEEILQQEQLAVALPYIDVLVDGPFILSQRDPALRFRGSRNQRIIPNPSLWGK